MTSEQRKTVVTSASGHERLLAALSRFVYKRRRVAGAVFLAVFAYAAFNTLTATRIYEARARVLIEQRDQRVLPFRQVLEERTRRYYFYQTQYGILSSRALARRALDKMQGWDTPPFGGAAPARGGPIRAVRAWPSRVVAWVRSRPPADAGGSARPADETRAQSRAVTTFLGMLAVQPVPGSRLADLRIRHADPVLAARAANALAEAYIEYTQEERLLASREANAWLNERLVEQRDAVERAEKALQAYRERHGTLSLDARDSLVVQRLEELNAEVTRAKTARIRSEGLHAQLRSTASGSEALDALPAVIRNPFIQQQKAVIASLERDQARMGETLGGRHPEMVKIAGALASARARLDAEIANIVASFGREYEAALAQERSLAAALSRQKADALALNRAAIGYGMLERELESATWLYTELQQRAKQTEVASELRATSFRIVDRAETPSRPVLPRTPVDLLGGVVTGVGLSAAVVFVLAWFDRRLTTPDDIREYLGLPSLGMLPLAPAGKGGYPLLGDDSPAIFAEAVRTLRTNVLFSLAVDGCRIVSVTSTGIGEGKSTVSSNLAIALAQSGERVLLVDADMRKPKVHTVFGVPQAPGLSDVLTRQAEAGVAIRDSGVEGLWLLSAGPVPPHPSELLGAAVFADTLAAHASEFDWMVVDAPPVMAVTDAALIGRCADGVLFVVGADMTSRDVALAAVESLTQVGAHVIGAVLNRVSLERDPYYYAHYYPRGYASYAAGAGSPSSPPGP